MNDIDSLYELLGQKPKPAAKHKTSIFTFVLRKLWNGWLGAVTLFGLCLLMAWVIHFPLAKIHQTKTKMDVMLIKEREGNRNNNISYEIVGQITGWNTTTNKYDEMAIMMSKPVMERMLRSRNVFDDAVMRKMKMLGSFMSKEDSTELLHSLTEQYTDKIGVTYGEAVKGEKNSIVTISITGGTPEHNEKVLSGLVDSYNQYTRDYNNMCYRRTISFLTHVIDSIKGELDKIDTYDEMFSESNFIIDNKEQTANYLRVDREDEDDVRNMQLQRELLKIIRQYMIDMGDNFVVVPANTGIEDDQINRIVIQFNDLVLRRSNFLTSMGEDAMRVMTITNQIREQREAIILSVDKLRQAYDIRMAKYEQNKHESEQRLLKMPHKRVVKDKIAREREIILPLYTLLQRKRVETIIAQAGEQDLARVIAEPYSMDEYMFKSAKFIYIFGLLLAILLSGIYLWFLQVPDEKVDLSDVLKDCQLPIWGVLPKENKGELYRVAVRALVTRMRMSGAKNILIASGYADEISPTLVTDLKKTLDETGMEKVDVHTEGDYHGNPEMPALSKKADATIYVVRAGYSQMRSIDFIGYAVKEGLLKSGAIIVTDAKTNETLPINFGAFDYEVPKGFDAVKSRAKK